MARASGLCWLGRFIASVIFTGASALLGGIVGCSPASADDGEGVTGEEGSALTLAQDEYAQLSAVLEQKLDERARTEQSGDVHPASVRPLSGTTRLSKDVCEVLRGNRRLDSTLPVFFVFVGASAGAGAIVSVQAAAELVWDLSHQQAAVFKGREIALSGSAGASAGVYVGLGIVDVPQARRRGEDVARNVVDGWSGDYFGVSFDIETPFKFAWASTGCITDKAGLFFACNIDAGLGISADILPINGEVMKGTVSANDALTQRFAGRSLAPRIEPMPSAEYEGKRYAYVQYRPLPVPGMERGAHARAALSMLMSMPLRLAVATGPLALALGVDADLEETRGTSLATTCPH